MSQNRNQKPFEISLSSTRLARNLFLMLFVLELLLVLMDATINFGRWIDIGSIRRLFNLTRDDGLGNWFASVQTLFVGLVLWVVFLRMKGVDPKNATGWALLAIFFTYLAIDDGSKVHERIGTAADVAGFGSSFPSYTWFVVLGPFFALAGIYGFLFLWRQLDDLQLRLWISAGFSFFAVAISLDFIEGLNHSQLFFSSDSDVSRHFVKVLEEFLEMLGMTCLLVCLLRFLGRVSPVTEIRFTP